jgi:hypothetical protein
MRARGLSAVTAMKALLIFTDTEAVPVFERVLAEEREGFTVLPAVAGSGRRGLKTGDRVHPGSSSAIFTVVTGGEEDATLLALRRARDEAGYGDRTRMWSFAVEEAD